jgi:hypothetical protein
MSPHQRRRRRSVSSFSSRATWGLVAASLLLASGVGASGPATAAQARECDKETAIVTSKMEGLPGSIRTPVDRGLTKASALSRFHRQDAALAQLDAVTALLQGPRGERVKDGARAALTKSIEVLRRCVAAAQPPPLATLSISVVEEGGRPAGEGVFVDVEGIPIGRTGPGGTLQADVPSGAIAVHATEYPSSDGANGITLAPGGSSDVSVVLMDSKEPSEDSDLVLEEAPDDILPANPASITLKFVQDNVPVRIDRIEDINISQDRDSGGESVKELFGVSDGAMHAQVPSAAYRRIAEQAGIGRPLWLVASAIDTDGRSHYGEIPFQLGQFKLDVVLGAPPSNPSLPVSNIPVRVSVVGSDVVLRRTSDAHGRFQIEALPDATIVFEGHTVASGIHYYTNASLTLCADRSVTLLMVNVKDLVAGVRELVPDPGAPACPHVPRR